MLAKNLCHLSDIYISLESFLTLTDNKAFVLKDHRSRRGRDKDESIGVRSSRIDRLPSGTKKGRQSVLASSGQHAASPPLVSPSGAEDEKR